MQEEKVAGRLISKSRPTRGCMEEEIANQPASLGNSTASSFYLIVVVVVAVVQVSNLIPVS